MPCKTNSRKLSWSSSCRMARLPGHAVAFIHGGELSASVACDFENVEAGEIEAFAEAFAGHLRDGRNNPQLEAAVYLMIPICLSRAMSAALGGPSLTMSSKIPLLPALCCFLTLTRFSDKLISLMTFP
jgi:hypothetical protein